MAATRKTKGERISRDSDISRDENSSEVQGNGDANSDMKVASDRLQREHFLKPDSDQIDLNLLLDAVLDINDKLRNQEQDTTRHARKYARDCRSASSSQKSPMKQFFPSQEAPKKHETRQNFSFRNEQVLAIDIENQRLLREINRPRPRSAISTTDRKFNSSVHEPVRIKTSSEVNRKRFQRRIDEENQALLRRLEAVKPTKSLNREYLLRSKATCDKKRRGCPSSACSSSGRLGTRSRTLSEHHFNSRNDFSSVEMSSTKKFSKPAWEAAW